MAQGDEARGAPQQINLDEVAKLVDALERDLAQVRTGSQDVQRLRDEVETLKNVLNSPIRRHHWVSDSLHGIRNGFDEVLDSAVAGSLRASQYIAEIGRILGL